MATRMSETRETSLKPSLKAVGATHQPQHLPSETVGVKTTPLKGWFRPFRGAEALRRGFEVSMRDEKGVNPGAGAGRKDDGKRPE
ncbi:UNVERIFIED_ORG: hypothetical protein GGI62_003346 [Rhizobium esperanzae]